MFESSLVESTPILQSRNRWPALLSFAIQAVIVTALLLIPLVHPEVLPLATLPRLALAAPRFVPIPPPIPVQPVRMQATNTAVPAASQMQAPRLSSQAFRTDANTVDAPALAVGMNLGDLGPNPLVSLRGISPTGAAVSLKPVGALTGVHAGPISVSRGVTAGLLLAPIQPQYPPIARISRTEGTVIVQAVISTSGRIESAHVLSGPEMLQAAALQAVRNARYRSFLLNDRPTEVETTISITFQLHN